MSNKVLGGIVRAVVLAVLLVWGLSPPLQAQGAGHADVLTVKGTIDPWVDSYIQRGIGLAEYDGAQAILIMLDTPGGTLSAMQSITTRMLEARVPVVVFVYPTGAWAASAGTFVAMAGNVAAMAPGTSIGAAHPVSAGGGDIPSDEQTKATNFSVSIIRNIAEQRGRNAEWAATAVRDSISATAEEALQQKVIDLIANDPQELLDRLDGRTVKTAAGEITLHTQGADLLAIEMNISERLFHTLVDPNVALLLLLLGLIAIAVELYNPGISVAIAVGVICLVLAFVALGNLPVNWGALILIVVSVILFIVDVKVNTVALTVGALVTFVVGALLLFTPFTPTPLPRPAVSVSPWLIAGLGCFMAGLFIFVLGKAVRARHTPILVGRETLFSAMGVALSDLDPSGQVRVKGEVWSAIAEEEGIRQGDAVQVVNVEGLRLWVTKERVDSKSSSSQEVKNG
jgi:membrane-bound serine protease (ClpP class)